MKAAPLNCETESYDVLVVGGGGAGLRAAYEAAATGARTAIALKGRITASGATAFGVAALAGFAVPDGVEDPQDSPDVHFDDIMKMAAGCADPRLARVLVDGAISAAADLEEWGVEFITDPATGRPFVAMGDFASRPRNRKIHHHGRPITIALKEKILEQGVSVYERTSAVSLLVSDSGVWGARFLREDGTWIRLRAGATILATGGAGQMFKYSLMPPDITGDGYALAYRAGAYLVNMEFIQAGFGILRPAINTLASHFWALLPELRDRNGEKVVERVIPEGLNVDEVMRWKAKHYPFTTSDPSMYAEIAAKSAMRDGLSTDRGGLYLDMRAALERVASSKERDVAVIVEYARNLMQAKRIDIGNAPVQVGLFGHSVNGGLVIGCDGESSLPGLYAVGETAGGPYGADRLGGNMLLNCQVFGKRAGRHAAETGRMRAANQGSIEDQDPGVPVRNEQGRPTKEATDRVKQIMTRDVLIIRNEEGLKRAGSELRVLHEEILGGGFEVTSPKQYRQLVEALNLTQTGMLVVNAALLRRETRGNHYREDYPKADPGLAAPIMHQRVGDRDDAFVGSFK